MVIGEMMAIDGDEFNLRAGWAWPRGPGMTRHFPSPLRGGVGVGVVRLGEMVRE
jgi:hypothetical protein